MPRRRSVLLLALALLLAGGARAAVREDEAHRFAIIGHGFTDGGEKHLKQALADNDDGDVAFLVVTGIKGANEPCTDKLYQKRRDLIDEAHRPVVVLPAGSDWTECRNTAGRTNAIERLNRIRELFYGEPNTLGVRKVALTRQSMSPRFRSYAENAHWSVGKVLYATINMPANNNHYLNEAGRNSEYEDRLVANRFWLNRLFAIARRDKLEAVVLFSEGDVKALSQPTGLQALLRDTAPDNDGFAEPRRLIVSLAQKFHGKVLLVDGTRVRGKPAIEWRGNVGHLAAGADALEVVVDPATKTLFKVDPRKVETAKPARGQ
ncbi:hypothetical protein NX784_07990 [Massilia pinisoli]|uniref:Transmembrane protein n=1 Tax=Massilia pinisoli TaxID=1772194 RepID=A0ABT1ZNP9_9BURK|nr:hypothetical protein [Massilia pinisoli]MCS0581529.1 hypothetical protein [Massilia pinisoli]